MVYFDEDGGAEFDGGGGYVPGIYCGAATADKRVALEDGDLCVDGNVLGVLVEMIRGGCTSSSSTWMCVSSVQRSHPRLLYIFIRGSEAGKYHVPIIATLFTLFPSATSVLLTPTAPASTGMARCEIRISQHMQCSGKSQDTRSSRNK